MTIGIVHECCASVKFDNYWSDFSGNGYGEGVIIVPFVQPSPFRLARNQFFNTSITSPEQISFISNVESKIQKLTSNIDREFHFMYYFLISFFKSPSACYQFHS